MQTWSDLPFREYALLLAARKCLAFKLSNAVSKSSFATLNLYLFFSE